MEWLLNLATLRAKSLYSRPESLAWHIAVCLGGAKVAQLDLELKLN